MAVTGKGLCTRAPQALEYPVYSNTSLYNSQPCNWI